MAVFLGCKLRQTSITMMSSALLRFSLVAFLVLLPGVAAKSKASTRAVTAVLDAKWGWTPLVSEISEFMAEEKLEYFWSYVDRIADIDPEFLYQGTDREHYDLLISEASQILSQEKIALLKFSLALRTHSPTVEMFHQIALTKDLPHCSAIIEVNSLLTCDPMELHSLLDTALERNRSDVYKFDHHFTEISTNADVPITVVLYGELGGAAFREFHFILKELAKRDKFDYVVRHFLLNRRQQKVRLSGYGVELAIKSTEYKAQDDTKIQPDESVYEADSDVDELDGFIFSKLKSRYPDKTAELEKLKDNLLEESQNLAPLKVWQLQELGLQAAQRIVSSDIEEALRVMRDTSQNFPALARSMVKIVVDENVQKEIAKNQNMFRQHLSLSPSDSALFINGIFFDPEVSDMFTIMDVVKEELSLIEQLHRLGVKSQQMERILSLDLSVSKEDYAVDIRDSAIKYVNDLESDRIYNSWPSSITEVLRPTYPGMMRSIRKNIFHVVAVVDPSVPECQDLLKLLESFYVHRAPIRIGLLFTVNQDLSQDGFTDAGVALLNAFNFVAEERGNFYQGLSFLTDIYAKVDEGKAVTSKLVIDALKSEFPDEDYELIFGLDSDYDTGRKLAWEFLSQTGLRGPPEVLVNGVRLPKNKLNGEDFEEVVLTEIMKQTAVIQKAVYTGELTDAQNVLDYMMGRENVVARLNDRVLNSTWKLIDASGIPAINIKPERFSELSSADKSASLVADMQYFTAKDDFSFRPITVWVVTDLGSEKGRLFLRDAIEQTILSNEVRIGVLHNPAEVSDPQLRSLIDGIEFASHFLTKKRGRSFADNLLKPETVKSVASGDVTLVSLLTNETEKELYQKWTKDGPKDTVTIHATYCQSVLQFNSGQIGLVVNGRILGPLDADEHFTSSDFNLLERHGLKTFGDKVRKVFEDVSEEGERDAISDLAFRVSALVLGRKQVRTRVELKYRSSEYSVVKVPPRDPEKPAFNVTVIVDPLSRGAQKISQMLLVLQEVLNCYIWVFLNPQGKLSEMPLKTFYRLVLEPEIQFTSDDKFALGPMARFQNMLVSPLFTMHMDVAENWLVELVKTPYDLDNIHLEKVDGTVYGEFELEHLLIEGHCFDQATGAPPRGLQFILGTPQNPRLVDTIVMANLGYFQLKAAPGAWFLNLRKGRSSEIYDVVSHEGTDSPIGSSDVQILVGNFRSHIVKIKVDKKPGKHHLDLLAESDEEGESGIWNSITSTFSSKKGTKDSEDDPGSDDVLNIFSLASGHLYERLLRIMMLSLLKNTKTPVKFWFLKNYLSPKLKDVLPMMAKKYNFQYELVQYKWPRWLHQQTEKQRTIWGYKILFLDVLFPLSVKKIIFVDADLIVRADLKELRDFDLGGAPYGYTPFCESKKEMDGYRFWKSGYWASHLQGRRYHISALYVVDLKKFRRIAAGDRLRGQYQGLSQDPNSLSNLDQDLPNNMIHQVAIKSLPQEWLWCETWCNDDTKAKAKTIDLCNNPQTKESKLSNAMRTSPEWIQYDDEIRNLIAAFEKQKVADKADEDDKFSETKAKSEHKQHGEL